jgi:hypothetical protein
VGVEGMKATASRREVAEKHSTAWHSGFNDGVVGRQFAPPDDIAGSEDYERGYEEGEKTSGKSDDDRRFLSSKATASRREALSGEDLAFRDLLSHDDELRDTLPPAWVNPQHHRPVKPWGVQSMRTALGGDESVQYDTTHRPTDKRELGYARRVCADCGIDWPCPDYAQAQERKYNSSLRTTALGETMAPAEVDTLRDESCPVCGEHDSYDGDKCSVCQFIKPPDEFLDPDLEKAKQVDLRQDQNAEEGLAAQDGAPDPDAAQAGPGQDGSDPAKPWLSKELPVGGPDPAADGAGGKPWEQKERPKDDAAAAPESTEDTEDQGQPWKQKTRRKSARATTQKENSMRTALQALAEQQQIINAQGRRIAVLEQGINLIAKAAGIDTHPRMAALLKRAADENPAQPEGWANPAGNGGGSEAPTESTDQAATPSNKDNVESTGEAPGTDVSPDATTSLDSTETVLDDGLDLNEQDVTKPVAGTDNLGKGEPGAANTNRIETEVRVGDPNKPDVAFAETGWTAAKQPTEGRTIASLRLARLRIEAGIETGTDDLDLGTAIAASEATDEAIQTEIDTLAKVVTANRATANQTRQATVARNLVPRTAGQAQRTVPSFTAEPQLPIQTVASGPSDDEFAFE